jgi:hypothetical protein
MYGVVEHHGRLNRADGRPANPGIYSLRFTLHATAEGHECLWEESLRGVAVASGGFFHVVLGQDDPISEEIFRFSPAWLAVQVIRSGRVAEETSRRVPMVGSHLLLHRENQRLGDRLARVEASLQDAGVLHLGEIDADAERMDLIEETVARLTARVGEVERTCSATTLEGRFSLLEKRVTELGDLDERLLRVEDEIDDIVGPDGDVVDLADRLEQIEENLSEAAAPERRGPDTAAVPQHVRLEEMERRISALGMALNRLGRTVGTPPVPDGDPGIEVDPSTAPSG